MQAIFETTFDVIYLLTVITLGVFMICKSKGRKQYLLYGMRAVALCTTGLESYTAALGIGKLITSVTMTAFYVLLYYVWRCRYKITGKRGITAAVWGLSALRVILCLMPQNEWTSPDAPLSWGIFRNIPFALLGLMIIILTFRSARQNGDREFRFLWLTIVLSFGFYIPVVLWADAVPLIGMLMIPKTCAYVWTVLIGFNSLRNADRNESEADR